MNKVFLSSTILFFFSNRAEASKNSLGLELGFGNPVPLCIPLGYLQDEDCGVRGNPRLSTRLEWHAVYPNGKFYPVLGLEYRRIFTDTSHLGFLVEQNEVLFTAQFTNLKPRGTGVYLRGGLTLGLLRTGSTTMNMIEGLNCGDSCTQLGDLGGALIPLTPIAGALSSLGLEAGGGYQWEGFSTGIHMMTDFFLFSVQIRTSYQIPI